MRWVSKRWEREEGRGSGKAKLEGKVGNGSWKGKQDVCRKKKI